MILLANDSNTFRWDTDGEPKLYKNLLLWKYKNNANQTSFTIEPNDDLRVGGYPLTVKNNRVVFGNEKDINIKVHPVVPHDLSPDVKFKFKFVSYNILTGHPYFENDFHPHISKELRTWGLGREKLVKAEVVKADIAVLVECTKAQLAYILQGVDRFEAHIELKIGEGDGTAILFDKSRFALEK